MKANAFIVNITSPEPERLKSFYREVVELPLNKDFGEEAYDAAGAVLIIDNHSETKGAAKEPQRVLLNFMVDDVAAEEQRLRAKGVPFIRSQGKEFWGGIISTFTDPDGNYCQILEYRPDAAQAPA